MCVCVCVCVCVCARARARAHTCVRAYVTACVYVCMRACVRACVCVWVGVGGWSYTISFKVLELSFFKAAQPTKLRQVSGDRVNPLV